ncbi:MAG: Ig-like domain-containing protein [Clostridia bacterium]|nr:Ig-like domain-containing protein [Clostridia bacterium]
MRKKTIRVLLAALSASLVFSAATACAGSEDDGKSSSSSTNQSSKSSSKKSSSKKSSSKSSSSIPPAPETPPAAEPSLEVERVGLSDSKLDLDKYEYYDLSVILNDGANDLSELPEETVISWATTDSSIATVDSNGRVTAVAEGSAVIGVTIENKTAYCTVTVVDRGMAATLELENVEESKGVGISNGDTFKAEVGVYFKGNHVLQAVDLAWTASEDGIVEITPAADCLSAEIKGVALGQTTIQVLGTVFGTPVIKEFKVNVVDASVQIDVSNLLDLSDYVSATQGGYNVALNLGTEGVPSVTPVLVYKNNNVVDSSKTFTWASDSEAIATVSSTGKITAKGVGETTVTATCGEYSVSFFIKVEKTFSADLGDLYFELAGGAHIFELPAALQAYGNLTKIEITNTSNTASQVLANYDTAGHIVTLDTATISANIAMGVNAAYFSFDTGNSISLDVKVCTKAIRTKSDLINWSNYATWASGQKYTGYFYLANNISFNDKYQAPYIWNRNLNLSGETGNGFNGWFDGQGYNIEGLEMSYDYGGGLVGVLAKGATVKNISFTNAVHYGSCGFIASGGDGIMQNIYIHAKEQRVGDSTINPSGFFYGKQPESNAAVINCFLQIDYLNTTPGYWADSTGGMGATQTIGGTFGANTLQGVYSVGGNYSNPTVASVAAGATNTAGTSGAYASYAALKSAGVDFTGWINEFWSVKNGLPYPKNLPDPVSAGGYADSMSAVAGGTMNDFKNLPLDTYIEVEGGTAGATLSNGVITVNSSAIAGTSFKINVFSVYSPDPVDQITVTIVDNIQTLTASKVQYAEIGDETNFDLSELSSQLSGAEFRGITVNGQSATSSFTSLSEIGLDATPFSSQKLGSTVEAIASFEKDTGSGKAIYQVKVPVMVVTMAISNADDLDRFIEVSYEADVRNTYWGGHFVLTNSFDYSASVSTGGTNPENYRKYYQTMGYNELVSKLGEGLWQSGRHGGFCGVFDGQGYTIDRLYLARRDDDIEGGFIGMIATDGVVKNVKFTNGYHEGHGGFICSVGEGTVQDVYVHLVYQGVGNAPNPSGVVYAKDCMGGARVNRVVIKVDSYDTASGQYLRMIGEVHEGYGIYNGVYAIGPNYANACNILSFGTGADNVYGAYADQAAFTAANIDFSSWTSTGFWTLDGNGDPVAPTK